MSTKAMEAEEAILNMLQRYEVLAMEDLIVGRPDFTWGQLFLAVDRLSRTNVIALSRFGLSYHLRLMPCEDQLATPQGQKEPAARLTSKAEAYRAEIRA
ncbi:protein of unknown function [Nitrospira japonica]|uniref:Uncharacterized protein n=1 Tax=Nitrospira japonica TaxID=1325564 RepID=A0A1W1I2Q1_9BACT|nr:hypothetical protein [Nitrospira japonica]SLM47251.1 protein of unknown function [Nitrospira japonica]